MVDSQLITVNVMFFNSFLPWILYWYKQLSNLILFIGLNTRLESATLNIKLKQRYAKGNIKFFTINSLIDLTYPTINLGSNLNVLKQLPLKKKLLKHLLFYHL